MKFMYFNNFFYNHASQISTYIVISMCDQQQKTENKDKNGGFLNSYFKKMEKIFINPN